MFITNITTETVRCGLALICDCKVDSKFEVGEPLIVKLLFIIHTTFVS